MKITISEALRLKKEIGNIIDKTMNAIKTSVSTGEQFENDVLVSEQDATNAKDALSVLEKLMVMSIELNNTIDIFNFENNIPSLVRSKKNAARSLALLTNLSNRSKPKTVTKNKVVHDKIITVTEKFVPYISNKDFRSIIKEHKNLIRQKQAEIDKVNTQSIEVGFDYDALSELEEIADSYNRFGY